MQILPESIEFELDGNTHCRCTHRSLDHSRFERQSHDGFQCSGVKQRMYYANALVWSSRYLRVFAIRNLLRRVVPEAVAVRI